MELTVLERFVLLNILPREGNMLQVVAAQNVRKAVELDEVEHDLLKIEEIKIDGGSRLHWNPEIAAAMDKDVDFTGPQTALIVEVLQKLDKDKKLTAEHLSLCEKFGIGKE